MGCVIVANGVDVPFRFEIASDGTIVHGFFFEGDRKVDRQPAASPTAC
jgi:hypothetical protein